MVRIEGVEPTHLAALDPKSSVSTNSTISAKMVCKDNVLFFNYNDYFVLFYNLRIIHINLSKMAVIVGLE